MKLQDIITPTASGNPLDRIPEDGGLCSIFRTIGCIGDSLSSGEMEGKNEKGNKTYHDYYEYSWGQFIARDTGSRLLPCRQNDRGYDP